MVKIMINNQEIQKGKKYYSFIAIIVICVIDLLYMLNYNVIFFSDPFILISFIIINLVSFSFYLMIKNSLELFNHDLNESNEIEEEVIEIKKGDHECCNDNFCCECKSNLQNHENIKRKDPLDSEIKSDERFHKICDRCYDESFESI